MTTRYFRADLTPEQDDIVNERNSDEEFNLSEKKKKGPFCKSGFLKKNCKYKWACKECSEYEKRI